MNQKIEIIVTVDDTVIINKIFSVNPGYASELFIEDIYQLINNRKTGKIKKGSLEI